MPDSNPREGNTVAGFDLVFVSAISGWLDYEAARRRLQYRYPQNFHRGPGSGLLSSITSWVGTAGPNAV